VRLIPAAAAQSIDGSIGKVAAVLIVLAWIVSAAMLIYLFLRFTKRI